MARFCELTGKRTLSGNNVSHSNRKTRRKFYPNIVTVKLESETLRKTIKFDLAARTLKTINFKGGLDEYLVKSKAHNLTEYGQKLRRQVKKLLEKAA